MSITGSYTLLIMSKFCTNFLLLLVLIQTCTCSLEVVRDLLQFNVAGHPVLHRRTEWKFDPDVGPKRARLYQETNGVYAEKAIERLGLGIDGNDQERLAQQRARDEGQLGGIGYNEDVPGAPNYKERVG